MKGNTQSRSLWICQCARVVCVLALNLAVAQEEPEMAAPTEISGESDDRISVEGSILSGAGDAAKVEFKWEVGDAYFDPSQVEVRSADTHPHFLGRVLEEKRPGLVLSRDVWIDDERDGVRLLDTIRNTSAETITIKVAYRSQFPRSWQSLYGLFGELLDLESEDPIDSTETGLVVRFDPALGVPDSVVLFGGKEAEGRIGRPTLFAGEEQRKWSLSYELTIEGKTQVSLLHWLINRSLPNVAFAPELLAPIYTRSQLIDPGLGEEQVKRIINFPKSAFLAPEDTSSGLETLISLNAVLDPIGLVRSGEDIQWLNDANRISGTLRSDGDLKINAQHLGEISLRLDDLAAIRGGGGGGGKGRLATFFLRNGEVRVGEPMNSTLSFEVDDNGKKTSEPIDLEKVDLITLRSNSRDGVVGEKAALMIQTHHGSVFAVQSPQSISFPLATPWSREALSGASLDEMVTRSSPFYSQRFKTNAGSVFPAFLSPDDLELSLLNGKSFTLSASQISTIWRVGASHLDLRSRPLTHSSENPAAGKSGIYLEGSTFLSGELVSTELRLNDEQTLFQLASNRVQSIERLDLESGRLGPLFRIRLKNGETLKGRLLGGVIAFTWEGNRIAIPIDSILHYQLSNG